MDIYKTIHQVAALRCTDDGVSFLERERLAYLSAVLSATTYRETLLPLARVYRSETFDHEKPFVVITSHVDELPTAPWSGEEEVKGAGLCLKGTYDNAITNAIVLQQMVSGRLHPQAVVAFTGNEEGENGHEMEGAKQVLKELRPRVGRDFFLVLDVTAEGKLEKDDFTLENVFPRDPVTRSKILGELCRRVANAGCFSCVPDGWEDEAWLFDQFGYACCTLCVPTVGPMHENEGLVVRKAGVTGYAAALEALSAPYPFF